jgi:hypothetical protein
VGAPKLCFGKRWFGKLCFGKLCFGNLCFGVPSRRKLERWTWHWARRPGHLLFATMRFFVCDRKFEATIQLDGDGIVAGFPRFCSKDLAAGTQEYSRIRHVFYADCHFNGGAFWDQHIARQQDTAETDVHRSGVHFLAGHPDQHRQMQRVANIAPFLTLGGVHLGLP